jgi:hypothetical protein
MSWLLLWHYHCNYETRLVLHWRVRMKQQSCWGVAWFFKRPRVSPLKKQKNWHHDIWCLIDNTRANRVAIVSSVITKIFNPCKHWTVKIQHSVLYVQWISVYSYSLPVFHCSSVVWFSFVSVLLCLNHFVLLFSVRLFVYSLYFSVLILELYSRYFDLHNNNNPASQ